MNEKKLDILQLTSFSVISVVGIVCSVARLLDKKLPQWLLAAFAVADLLMLPVFLVSLILKVKLVLAGKKAAKDDCALQETEETDEIPDACRDEADEEDFLTDETV